MVRTTGWTESEWSTRISERDPGECGDPDYHSTNAKRTLVVDFDSTLWPLFPAIAALGEEFSHINYDVCETWDTLIDLCGGMDKMLDCFSRAMAYESQIKHPPFPGAVDTLHHLRILFGIQIIVLTDRTAENAAAVMDWLRHYDIPADDLIYACSDKVELMEQMEVADVWDVVGIIDDKPLTIQRAYDVGFNVIGLDIPYARTAMEELGITPAKTWHDIYAEVYRWLTPTLTGQK